jgi:hypothetical protein
MKPGKIHYLSAFLIILVATSCIISCKHETDISNLPAICFEKQVLPIFISNCAVTGCHAATGPQQPLDDYPSIFKSVIPYKPDESASYGAIISSREKKRMPPGQPLPLELRTIIRVWIEQGARNDTSACSGQ